MLYWYVDDLLVFFRKRGRTSRASRLLTSRATLTLGLRKRKRRRQTAARTPVICVTRSSRRAALCFDTNTNTQVNTHATSHKAFPRLRFNKHATRNHSLLGGNMSQSLSNRRKKWGDFFLRNSAEQGGHLHSNRYYSTCSEEDWESVSANSPPLPASRVNSQVLREASSASHFQRLFHWPRSRMTSLVKLAGEFPQGSTALLLPFCCIVLKRRCKITSFLSFFENLGEILHPYNFFFWRIVNDGWSSKLQSSSDFCDFKFYFLF